MPTVNMQNVVDKNNSRSKQNNNPSTKKPNNSFVSGLNKTWAFRQKLSDFDNIFKVLIVVSRVITFIMYSLIYIIKSVFLLVFEVCKQNKIIRIVVLSIIVLFVVWLVDFTVNYGKIYPGVYVNDIDLGGKTADEAYQLIDEKYSSRLSGNNVVIYVNDEAKELGMTEQEGSGLAEQLSVDQAKQTVRYWKTNSVELDASFPIWDIVDDALNSTRGINNIFNRIGAFLFKKVIVPYAIYNSDALNDQIHKVNDTIGSPVVNPTCIMEDGQAKATEGSDGFLIHDDEFISQLNKAFFEANPEDCCFVPKLYTARQNISFNSAKSLSNQINSAMDKKVSFVYKNLNWDVDRLNLSNWINIGIDDNTDENQSGCSCAAFNNNYSIFANVDTNKVGSDILLHTRDQEQSNQDYSIKFEKQNSSILVKTEGDYDIPSIYEAVDSLNNLWLENARVSENGKNSFKPSDDNNDIKIEIKSTKVPESLSLDEAIKIGVVTTISEYSTNYSSGAGTENRNHNIALAASLVNNSICSANGGTWSFNQICGDCDASKGFLEAGAVLGNIYTKSIGGGVCQVATTIFNTVYDSGYEIVARYPHDLHMASYPAGRDAAINYPDLDLIWRNNENSDTLLQASSTGYSVSCKMLGVNPKYTVKTEVGEWSPGDPHASEIVIDPSKEKDSKYIQTSGSDGKSIVVKRLVYSTDGKLIREDSFKSNYKPKTEITVIGPGEEADKLLAENKARMKRDNDNW